MLQAFIWIVFGKSDWAISQVSFSLDVKVHSSVVCMIQPYLIFLLFFILVYVPPFSIVAEGKLIRAHKLHMAKIFCPLGNDTCDFGRHEHVHLRESETERDEETKARRPNVRIPFTCVSDGSVFSVVKMHEGFEIYNLKWINRRVSANTVSVICSIYCSGTSWTSGLKDQHSSFPAKGLVFELKEKFTLKHITYLCIEIFGKCFAFILQICWLVLYFHSYHEKFEVVSFADVTAGLTLKRLW